MSQDHKLLLAVETLKLPQGLKDQLKLSGFTTLEDFNTFTIKEIKILLKDHFDSVIPVLRNYILPRYIENSSLSKDGIEALKQAGINDLKQLFAFDKKSVIPHFSR